MGPVWIRNLLKDNRVIDLDSSEWNRLEFGWATSDSDEVVFTSFYKEGNKSNQFRLVRAAQFREMIFGLDNEGAVKYISTDGESLKKTNSLSLKSCYSAG